ncbi:MAG: TrpB-like pyridoxal phosphate-dependent enzyme [Eubacteriales bacterium]|nr:TrpB-like pyridoxal phosphate-dependent enzyme [Bacillota bacterium]MBV1726662.1 TrpB-like pyridoxal phosphate-dependent enzyme [Desulforudis sp.]MDP3051545.1 TrpB-like pyridoxal phosphate-dependent enzyme [Eubacteriales bacterium]MDQ7789820.1 TrpB-like pyridoxal phosphate-dependent enzyme [Clostridia bacterium]MBU4553961.1 TrpB-like pyridoxal phosphate-dependent enzyme [Bacillota bacterium]
MSEIKILLTEEEMPTAWYNVQADMPNPMKPPLHPGTHQPVTPEDLMPIFPMELIKQEATTERWVEIPDEVREILRIWRPSPLIRATRLEKALDTPARIYFKNEGVSPAGSHKLNTAVPQAYYNKQAGIKRLATETGAGQWGSALSMACNFFGMECTVYMVKVSYHQKPYRRSLMQMFDGEVIASPSNRTNSGRQVLEADPDSQGSLGIAISEAVEDAATREDTNYALGSVLNHVLLHQTVTGLETKAQLAKAGEQADVIIGCCGGGSNFGGFAFPFLQDRFAGTANPKFIAVEPTSCPTLTRGKLAYDFGDVAGLTPLIYMYTLGSSFMPPGIHAGGLRYHGDAPLLCHMVAEGYIEPRGVNQTKVFESAMLFAKSEGMVPAPESAHAIAAAIDEAIACREAGEAKTIVFNLSGHGHFDLAAYDVFLSNQMEDFPLPEEDLKRALASLPNV